ncbi:MAG: DUF72 domain-containing protein [Pseudomonadota bacterium]
MNGGERGGAELAGPRAHATGQHAPRVPGKAAPSLIGCAGWSIARASAAAFPAEGSQLERYASVFDAVEINSSFYRPHRPQTYARWAESVPERFRFSVKLPRSITHDQRLHDIDDLLEQFAVEVGSLGKKLGCVLVQLPPSLRFDPALAQEFTTRLRGRFDCMLALEARHASWFDSDASALLEQRHITRVVADPPAGQPGPHQPTTSERYWRLHGSPHIYYSAYSDAFLARLRAELDSARAAGHRAWCIFDNTASGAATGNALALQVPTTDKEN